MMRPISGAKRRAITHVVSITNRRRLCSVVQASAALTSAIVLFFHNRAWISRIRLVLVDSARSAQLCQRGLIFADMQTLQRLSLSGVNHCQYKGRRNHAFGKGILHEWKFTCAAKLRPRRMNAVIRRFHSLTLNERYGDLSPVERGGSQRLIYFPATDSGRRTAPT